MKTTLSATDARCHEWAVRAFRIVYFRNAVSLPNDPQTVADLANRIIAERTRELAAQDASRARDTAAEAWEYELAYIQATAAARDWASFNGDAACFARYVRMQARHVGKLGHAQIAARMLATLDAQDGAL